MVDRLAIQPHMDVLSSDGTLVGKVDQLEGEAIRLARAGSADGRHHLVPLTWIDRVDARVHLNVDHARVAVLTGGAALGGAAVGAGSAGATEKVGEGPMPPVRNPAVEGARPRGNYYLPWVLGLLLLALLLFFLLRGLDDDDEDDEDLRPVASTAEVTTDRGSRNAYATGTIAYDLDRFLASNEAAPRTFTFDRLNFDTGAAAVRQTDVADIDQLAQVLTTYPAARIAIIGYTDARGSGRANARLGEERAESVAAALAARGIARNRLEARSGGEQAPLADNDRSEGRAENRRTELIVLSR